MMTQLFLRVFFFWDFVSRSLHKRNTGRILSRFNPFITVNVINYYSIESLVFKRYIAGIIVFFILIVSYLSKQENSKGASRIFFKKYAHPRLYYTAREREIESKRRN